MPVEYVGRPVKRLEDPRLLTGADPYVNDVRLDGALVMAVARSPYAHARIVSMDTSAAEAMPGVAAVVTSKDFRDISPYAGRGKKKDHPIVAVDRVIFAGQPVAAIAAIDRGTAEDALNRIQVEYDELPAVITVEEAIADGAPLVHDFAERNMGVGSGRLIAGVERHIDVERAHMRERGDHVQDVLGHLSS